jgi:predicted  nucleic acid-binding Zn-ribbon protein
MEYERRAESPELSFIRKMLENNSVLLQNLNVSVVEMKTELKHTNEHIALHAKEIKELKDRHSVGCPLLREVNEDFDKLELRVKTIEQKPLKAMDKVWMALLGALGGGLGMALFKKFGL